MVNLIIFNGCIMCIGLYIKFFNSQKQGFFSKFLMVGTQNFQSPSVPDRDEIRWGGELEKNIWLKAIFCYFKHEIQLLKVLLSLKVVKFDTKMYLNFSNFRGQTSAGVDKPWSKNGDKCRWGGGLAKFSPDGGPPSPPRKKPWEIIFFSFKCTAHNKTKILGN